MGRSFRLSLGLGASASQSGSSGLCQAARREQKQSTSDQRGPNRISIKACLSIEEKKSRGKHARTHARTEMSFTFKKLSKHRSKHHSNANCLLLLSFFISFLLIKGCKGQFQFCDNKEPRGGHSCEKQKSWGKCTEQWFVDGNYCRRTCGKCVDFDPRTAETKLRQTMRQCQIEDEKLIQTCLDMVQGNTRDSLLPLYFHTSYYIAYVYAHRN